MKVLQPKEFQSKLMMVEDISDLLSLVQFYAPVTKLIDKSELGNFVSTLYHNYNLNDKVFVMYYSKESQRTYYYTYEFYHVETDEKLLAINKG